MVKYGHKVEHVICGAFLHTKIKYMYAIKNKKFSQRQGF